MVPRNRYLEKLIAFRDTDVIKVVTGMRRCGKSTLLDMMRKHLEDNGVPSECLLTFKMESFELEGVRDWRELYRHVNGLMPAGKRCYLFFDELQEVAGWEKAINALRVDRDCDMGLRYICYGFECFSPLVRDCDLNLGQVCRDSDASARFFGICRLSWSD